MRSIWPRAGAIAFVCVVLAIAMTATTGCSKGGGSANSEAEKTPESSPSQEATSPTEQPITEGSTNVPTATIKTNKGTFKVAFFPEKAPKHVEAFLKLSKDGFYNGNKIHRYEPGFVVQMGDPQTNSMSAADVIAKKNPAVGTGGPGYNLPAEFNDERHVPGTVAMARSQDPNSGGSQFYIVVGEASFLDGQYTVFGKVTEGYDDVVTKLRVGDEIESIAVSDAE